MREKLNTYWTKSFENSPAFCIFSPGRINLIGEHTDYNHGWVLPSAIDKGIYLAISKSDNNQSKIISIDKIESLTFSHNESLTFEKGAWQNYIIGVVKELEKMGKQTGHFNAVFFGTIPQGAGLSSSAALENAFTIGLNHLFDCQLSKWEMAKIGQKAEHNYAGVKCGIMDQFASMMGQENELLLLDCLSLDYQSFPIKLENHELLLINSHVSHQLADSAYNQRRKTCENAFQKIQNHHPETKSFRDASIEMLNNSSLSETEFKRSKYIIEENVRVHQVIKNLTKNDISTVGKLLFKAHDGLQNDYEVSCAETDFLVQKAKDHKGVIGARQMGGGFGGCTINIVSKNAVDLFIEETSVAYQEKFDIKMSVIPIKIEAGTRILAD